MLGIAAASFASVFGTMGFGNGELVWERYLGAGKNEASKDRAESPARSERPKKLAKG